ncbi:MAG: glycosyltransferase involved in cell wall biosynthesis [Arenicella sp.]|jgi:glycosyltransferase involved in cell wall biosynthesis
MSTLSSLSILLPCYNPPEGWEKQVVKSMDIIKKELKSKVDEVHLVIVNDGSSSNCTQEQQDYITTNVTDSQFVNYEENRGKGYALRQGVKVIKTNYTVYTDIDFPYHEESVLAIANTLLNGASVALGHRGKEYYKKTPWFRKVVSKTLRWVLKTFLRLPTDDSQCGLKGYDQIGASVFLTTRIDRFLFDLEFIKLAARKKLKIEKVNVELKPNVVFSKVNTRVLLIEFGNFIKVLFRK